MAKVLMVMLMVMLMVGTLSVLRGREESLTTCQPSQISLTV